LRKKKPFPGEYTISVRKMVPDRTYTDEEYEAVAAKGRTLEVNSNNLLPEKYGSSTMSGLKFTVVTGKKEDLLIDLD